MSASSHARTSSPTWLTATRARLEALDRFIQRQAVTVIWLLLAAVVIPACAQNLRHGGSDYAVFARAGARFLAGEHLYRLADGVQAFKYAPGIAALFIPLAGLPPSAGVLLFDLASALALALFLGWSASIQRRSAEGFHHLVVVLLTVPFFFHLFSLGQCDAFLLLAYGTSERWAERRPVLSGVLWGLAVLAKPPFLVLLPVAMLFREHRRLAAMAAGMLAGLAVPVLRYGPAGTLQQLHDWRELLARTTPPWLCADQNQSLSGAVCTYLVDPGHPWFGAVVLGLSAAVVGSVGLAWWRIRRRGAAGSDRLLCNVAGLHLTAFLSPLGWRTNLLGAAPALYLLLDLSRRREPGAIRRASAVALLALLAVERLDYELVGSARFRWLLLHRALGLAVAAAVGAALALLVRSEEAERESLAARAEEDDGPDMAAAG